MITTTIIFAALLAGQTSLEPDHARNSIFKLVLDEGLESSDKKVTLPKPRLVDGQDAESQRAALREAAGSDRALDDLLRDSVTAPYIIKVRDLKSSNATIRQADVWFVAYSELKQVDFGQEAARTDQKEVEVANMWFQTRLLKENDLRGSGIKAAPAESGQNQWYSHVHSKLLDRIDFEVTNLIVASQSADSIVVASRTDPAFAKAGSLANAWKPIPRDGGSKTEITPKPYEGGMSYAKISRLAIKPGALLVEIHMAFVEPDGWFQGAPILRSKFSVAAQDQIRTLRRELAKKRGK